MYTVTGGPDLLISNRVDIDRWQNIPSTTKAWRLVVISPYSNRSGQAHSQKQFLSLEQVPEARHGRCSKVDRMMSAPTPLRKVMTMEPTKLDMRSRKLATLEQSSLVSAIKLQTFNC
jgi:hypothetical protein